MRIGVWADSEMYRNGVGGATTFQHGILEALCQHNSGHEVFVFSDNPLPFDSCSSVTFVQLKKILLTKKYFFHRVMRRLLRTLPIKFLSEPILYDKLLDMVINDRMIEIMWFITPEKKCVTVPFLYTVWDLEHRRQPYFPEVGGKGNTFLLREKQYGTLLPQAAYVIIGNQKGKEDVMRFYGLPEERVKPIPLPTPPFALNAPVMNGNLLDQYGIEKPYIFYPAQFWPHKNHVVILRALALLRQKGMILNVVFTGADKGNKKYIQDMANALGLQDQVNFLGFVTTDILITLYQQAWAMVFASFFGPDNIPPLEAMALGCPVIVADVFGIRDQLGDDVLYIDPRCEDNLVEVIMSLYKNEALYKGLIDRGKKRAQAFTCEDYIIKVMTIIDEFKSIRRCWDKKT